MSPENAVAIAKRMQGLFHDIDAGNIGWWMEELGKDCYTLEHVTIAVDRLAKASQFCDRAQFSAVWKTVIHEGKERERMLADDHKRMQDRLSEMTIHEFWQSADTCVDAMSDDEFNEYANIALIEVPDRIRERFSKTNLREIRSIRGRGYELYKSEQP